MNYKSLSRWDNVVGQRHKVLYPVIFLHTDLLPNGEEEREKKPYFIETTTS